MRGAKRIGTHKVRISPTRTANFLHLCMRRAGTLCALLWTPAPQVLLRPGASIPYQDEGRKDRMHPRKALVRAAKAGW